MSKYYIGEVVTRFFYGEAFRFEYVGFGEFKKLSGGIVPACIKDELFNQQGNDIKGDIWASLVLLILYK